MTCECEKEAIKRPRRRMFQPIKLSVKSNYSAFSLDCDSPTQTLTLGERVMTAVSYPADVYVCIASYIRLVRFSSKTWIATLHNILCKHVHASASTPRTGFPPQLEVVFNKSGTLINVNVIIRHLLLHPLCHQTYVRRNSMEIIHLHQTNEV